MVLQPCAEEQGTSGFYGALASFRSVPGSKTLKLIVFDAVADFCCNFFGNMGDF
jgi:hypothetical protein